MPRLVDHHASRALAYRTRAIELAQQAKREDDPGQRRYLIDLARNFVNVADAMDRCGQTSRKFSANRSKVTNNGVALRQCNGRQT
jgi:hypothetical protein